MNRELSEAHRNLRKLQKNPYPGRGMVVGLDETGEHFVQMYWLTGRSESSRNRVLRHDGARVSAELHDPKLVKHDELLFLKFYNAMDEVREYKVVSNGVQTDTITHALCSGKSFYEAMCEHTYEPDQPINTPRIAAVLRVGPIPTLEMAVVRKSLQSHYPNHCFYCYGNIPKGFGYCLMTYANDGNPPPIYRGEPFLLPLEGSLREIRERYWQALNARYRVSLAIKAIATRPGGISNLHIVNRHETRA